MDQLGQVTTFSYNRVPFEGQTVLLTITTDPLGRQTLVYQDGKGRALRQEKKDEQGALLSQVDHYYDLNGNAVKQEHQVLDQGKVLRTYAFGNTFGPGNLLLTSIEGLNSENSRITQYLYDSCSRLQCTIKPDGTSFYRTYDSLCRLATHEGPDFCYSYTYNAADDLIAVNNITRTYDPHHRLLSETTPSGTITYTRDQLGRRICLKYLGQEVSYTYQGPYLATLSCQNLTHSYLEYDLEGRPTLEKLPGQCGYKKRTYDPKGRLTHLETDYFSQDLAYDAVSNLISLRTKSPSQNWEESFSYDSLNQLSSEPSSNYTHDSIGNRLSENGETHSYDALNQRLKDPYDLCGRLLQAGPHKCHYDSLDRLVQLDDRHLNYDAFHRREDLLYDGQLELGNKDALRILAINAAGDIGAMRLIFLSGEPFVPIMDHLGSVVAFVTPKGELCESRRYSAFGIPSQESVYENPWGFCSKRQEGELLLFGYRYYHPQAGRWISPDPSGHTEGPNLYAYCHNNPLGIIDPLGLKGFKEWCSEKTQAVKDFFTRDRDKGDRVSSDLILRDPELEERAQTSQQRDLLKAPVKVVGGVVHGAADFVYDFSHNYFPLSCRDIETSLIYLGAASSNKSPQEKGRMLGRIEQKRVRQRAAFDDFLMGVFQVDSSDPLYRDCRIGAKNGIELGIVFAGAYETVRGGINYGLTRLSRQTGRGVARRTDSLANSSQVTQVESAMNSWLGESTTLIHNKAGDPVILSKDGLRRVRFDFKRPYPHQNPHMHVDEYMGCGIWKESGQIYPIDVPHN
ncbi:MAG: RHS repeat-associated core domain-containing protein [Verrucomicrobia bacterium]|nr:RHS repeat-associated core domain-containing protein [Verrucomicrobiota bacterium]